MAFSAEALLTLHLACTPIEDEMHTDMIVKLARAAGFDGPNAEAGYGLSGKSGVDELLYCNDYPCGESVIKFANLVAEHVRRESLYLRNDLIDLNNSSFIKTMRGRDQLAASGDPAIDVSDTRAQADDGARHPSQDPRERRAAQLRMRYRGRDATTKF
jgi:hypothetical protein